MKYFINPSKSYFASLWSNSFNIYLSKYYSKYGRIFLKVHPRDNSDYSHIDAVLLSKHWPSELLTVFDIKFDYAVGICTSSITTVKAKKKMNINENFLHDLNYRLVDFS